MDKITDGVYIGPLQALNDVEELKSHGITGIISLVKEDVPDMATNGGFQQLQVQIDDDEDQDIMQYFGQTNKFIEGILASGNSVLVHCVAGVSRSVTIVCAYLLHRAYTSSSSDRSEKLSVDDAISTITKIRPSAGPNDGFLEQLEIYLASGCEISNEKPLYRQWLLKKQAEGTTYTGMAPVVSQYVSSSASGPAKQVIGGNSAAVQVPTSQLRCKKCR